MSDKKVRKAVYTNIRTLTKAFEVLKEIGLGELMAPSENKIAVNTFTICDQLLKKGLLVEFLQEITNDFETEWKDVPLKAVLGCVSDFFKGISEEFAAVELEELKKLLT